MKKNIVCYFLLLFIFSSYEMYSQAQVRYGIRLGVNVSNMDFSKGSPPPDVPVETSYRAGGAFGFLIIIPLSGNFFIQPEYLFSQIGSKIDNNSATYHLNYLSLPVFLRWEILNSLAIIGGPQFGLLIDAKEKMENENRIITKGLEDRSLAATFGAEYSLSTSFMMGVKYMRGINHITSPEILENQGFKYEMIQFSVIYIF